MVDTRKQYPVDEDDAEGRDDIDPTESPSIKGEEDVSGSSASPTSDDDVGEMVEDVIGNEPEQGKPFSIAEEVEKDEKARRDVPTPKDEEQV